MALVCAQRYYVEHGAVSFVNIDVLEKELPNYLPENKLTKTDENLSAEKWVQLILNVFRKVKFF